MELDYIEWCASRLTPSEFLIYTILLNLGEIESSCKAISKIANTDSRTLSYYLQTLEKKKFLVIKGRYSRGVSILWVRQTQQDKQPCPQALKTNCYDFRIKSPEGKLYRLHEGGIAKFCRKHDLTCKTFYAVLSGRYKQHKGWTLAHV